MEEIKKRTIRGKEDKDERFFSSKEIERLRHAQEEVVWLLNRNYPISNIIDFVGGRYQFSTRQRMAIRRASCSIKDLEVRRDKEISVSSLKGKTINIDAFNFIDEHVKEKQGVFFLIKMVLESYEIPKNLKDEYERMKQQCCDKEKNEIIDCIVEEGVREGLIREENVFLRRAAVETQLSVYFMYRIAAEKKMELDLEADSLREYIYQNLLKLLG